MAFDYSKDAHQRWQDPNYRKNQAQGRAAWREKYWTPERRKAFGDHIREVHRKKCTCTPLTKNTDSPHEPGCAFFNQQGTRC